MDIQIGRRHLRLAIHKSKRFIEFLTCGLLDAYALAGVKEGPSCKEDRIAIVQLKLLGDYILWLPFALSLVDHFDRENKVVVLIGNKAWADLAKLHFPNCVFVGIDRDRFIRDWPSRRETLRTLRSLNVTACYVPSHPRDCLVEDAVVRALHAPALGFKEVFPDRPWIDDVWNRRRYSRLIRSGPSKHVQDEHGIFLNEVGAKVRCGSSAVSSLLSTGEPTSESYFVVAPGASRGHKQWPIDRFVEVAKRMSRAYPRWRCVVVGTQAERATSQRLVVELGSKTENLAGETSLVDLIDIVAKSRFVLGNDSAVVHIAAACRVPSVLVVGGGHYGRFFPYPNDLNKSITRPVSVANPMRCFGCDWICRYRTPSGKCFPCVDNVTIDMVWLAVKQVLDSDGVLGVPRTAMNTTSSDV